MCQSDNHQLIWSIAWITIFAGNPKKYCLLKNGQKWPQELLKLTMLNQIFDKLGISGAYN